MLPAPQSLLQASVRRLHPMQLAMQLAAWAVTAAALSYAGQALAQDTGAQDTGAQDTGTQHAGQPVRAESQPSTAQTGETAEENTITFTADRVEYLEDDDIITASGNVVLRRGGQTARSDAIKWNRKTGIVTASGNVRLVDEDGNELYTDQAELTDELKTGAMQNMLLVLREGGRIAAISGQRDEKGDIILNRVAYSACSVEDSQGCPKEPSWKVTADRVIYDSVSKRIRFHGARLEFFGAVPLPLPGLRIATDGRAVSGLLIPNFSFTPSNGVEINQSYFIRFSENRDLTATVYTYTDVPPMAGLQYRALTSKGTYQITGYATESRRIPVDVATVNPERDFRGYIFANGRFQLSPNWSVTTSLRRATDRTFLRRYDLSRDDRLRSMVDVERIDDNSYLSIAGWATQTMRVGDSQGQVPVALPAIDYRRRLASPVLGGRIELQANSLAILRTTGQDTQRVFAGARWDLQRYTPLGQKITLTALARGDVYHSDENDLTTTDLYRGHSGWETRGVALAAADLQWPFVGKFLGGTQVLTPHFQLVASPPIRNLAVPNEDARAIDLEDSNLFALNRFPGYDRIEDGVRFTYGLDWQFERPSWRIKTTVGQSIRLSKEPALLPQGTGLTNRSSDIVGRTEIRFRDIVKFTHRFRLDKDSFTVRRNEIDATVGDHRSYAEVGYVKLNRDIGAGLEDLQDREELRLAGRVAFARYWSLFGSTVVNLTNRAEDPTFGSDGFQPLRTRVGAAYQDDCLEIALTWRRDYVATGDARKGNSFQIHFALRNLGIR